MQKIHLITFLLVILGGINWLLFGVFGWDIVADTLGGSDSPIAKVIYILIGLAALYEIVGHKAKCKVCGEMMAKKTTPIA